MLWKTINKFLVIGGEDSLTEKEANELLDILYRVIAARDNNGLELYPNSETKRLIERIDKMLADGLFLPNKEEEENEKSNSD